MRRAMRLGLKNLFLAALVCCALALAVPAAQACPMCNQSIAGQDQLPHAYMYSILFMLGMPALVFAGIGGAIYYKFRKFYAAAAAIPVPAGPPAEWQSVDETSQAA